MTAAPMATAAPRESLVSRATPDAAPLPGLTGLLVLADGTEGALGATENVVVGETGTVSVLLP